MSKYAQIQHAIWNDPGVASLGRYGNHLYGWLINNTNITTSGIYLARVEQMMIDTKMSRREVLIGLAEIEATGMASYHDGAVFVRGRAKHVGLSIGKHANLRVSIVRDVAELPPDHPHRVAFLRRYADDPWLGPHLTDLLDESSRNSDGIGESVSPTQALGRASCMSTSTSSPLSLENRTAGRAREPRFSDDELAAWAAYLDEWYPTRRGRVPRLEDHIDVVRAALAVATLDEVKLAIVGHSRSSFHRDSGHKAIRYALRPTRKGESVRSRIEMMADRAEASGVARMQTYAPTEDVDIPDMNAA